MARKLKPDKALFGATIILLGCSVLMVYSASSAELAQGQRQVSYYYLLRQLMWVVFGCVLLAGVMKVDYRLLKKSTVIWPSLILTGIALVAVLFSEEVNGTTRWFNLGPFGVQPSELVKITIILALARSYHDLKFEKIKKIKNLFFPFLILFLPFVLVVIQPDLGTALSITILGVAILFAS